MKKSKSFIASLFVRKEHHLFLFFLCIHLVSLIVLFTLFSIEHVRLKELSNRVEKNTSTIEKIVRLELTPPVVSAQSFVLLDATTGKIITGKNEYTKRPLASLTKLRTAYIFASRNSVSREITIPLLGNNHDYDFLIKPKDVWSADDLIKFMLIISSNDAAEILSNIDKDGKEEFMKAMNKSISASSSPYFTTPSGLDYGDIVGGYGSAYDAALMMKNLYDTNPLLLEATTKKTLTVTINGEKYTGVPNTNQDVISYPGVLGSKTGFTDKAGGNLAVIFDNSLGKPLIAVVLNSTKDGRFEDMRKIIDFAMKNREILYQD